jgi:hypothetical protein
MTRAEAIEEAAVELLDGLCAQGTCPLCLEELDPEGRGHLDGATCDQLRRAIRRGDEPRCPTCDSPDAHRHPAVQLEGEVELCADAFHRSTTLGREALGLPPDEAQS